MSASLSNLAQKPSFSLGSLNPADDKGSHTINDPLVYVAAQSFIQRFQNNRTRTLKIEAFGLMEDALESISGQLDEIGTAHAVKESLVNALKNYTQSKGGRFNHAANDQPVYIALQVAASKPEFNFEHGVIEMAAIDGTSAIVEGVSSINVRLTAMGTAMTSNAASVDKMFASVRGDKLWIQFEAPSSEDLAGLQVQQNMALAAVGGTLGGATSVKELNSVLEKLKENIFINPEIIAVLTNMVEIRGQLAETTQKSQVQIENLVQQVSDIIIDGLKNQTIPAEFANGALQSLNHIVAGHDLATAIPGQTLSSLAENIRVIDMTQKASEAITNLGPDADASKVTDLKQAIEQIGQTFGSDRVVALASVATMLTDLKAAPQLTAKIVDIVSSASVSNVKNPQAHDLATAATPVQSDMAQGAVHSGTEIVAGAVQSVSDQPDIPVLQQNPSANTSLNLSGIPAIAMESAQLALENSTQNASDVLLIDGSHLQALPLDNFAPVIATISLTLDGNVVTPSLAQPGNAELATAALPSMSDKQGTVTSLQVTGADTSLNLSGTASIAIASAQTSLESSIKNAPNISLVESAPVNALPLNNFAATGTVISSAANNNQVAQQVGKVDIVAGALQPVSSQVGPATIQETNKAAIVFNPPEKAVGGIERTIISSGNPLQTILNIPPVPNLERAVQPVILPAPVQSSPVKNAFLDAQAAASLPQPLVQLAAAKLTVVPLTQAFERSQPALPGTAPAPAPRLVVNNNQIPPAVTAIPTPPPAPQTIPAKIPGVTDSVAPPRENGVNPGTKGTADLGSKGLPLDIPGRVPSPPPTTTVVAAPPLKPPADLPDTKDGRLPAPDPATAPDFTSDNNNVNPRERVVAPDIAEGKPDLDPHATREAPEPKPIGDSHLPPPVILKNDVVEIIQKVPIQNAPAEPDVFMIENKDQVGQKKGNDCGPCDRTKGCCPAFAEVAGLKSVEATASEFDLSDFNLNNLVTTGIPNEVGPLTDLIQMKTEDPKLDTGCGSCDRTKGCCPVFTEVAGLKSVEEIAHDFDLSGFNLGDLVTEAEGLAQTYPQSNHRFDMAA